MEKQKKKIAFIVAIIFLLMAFLLFLYLFQTVIINTEPDVTEDLQAEQKNKLHVYQKLPEMVLEDESGGAVILNQKLEEVSVFIYWASWCPHCKDSMSNMEELTADMEAAGAQVFFINKLDGEKETKEQALEFLESQNGKTETLFDIECTAYEEIGLHMIPTTMVLNKEQRITSVLEGSIPSSSQAKAMIEEAKQGKAVTMLKAMQKTLFNGEGGMYTNYTTTETTIPSGTDVLSESLGIIMEYAAFTEKKSLFDQTWNYVKEHLFSEGLMPWVITDKSGVSVNALIDDFRIISALQEALNKWEGYKDDLDSYKEAIITYNMENKELIDFYDTESQQKADRFTLCYGDLQLLKSIKSKDRRFGKIYDTTLKTIQNGVISEEFPLYYSYYDYNAEKYVGKELNMTEALTTLLHLAEVNQLPREAMGWLETKLEEGCIYAVYDITGKPTENGYFESTAVYALTAMIALEEGREDLAGKAITRMEQFRVVDAENRFNGIFGGNDGTGIYSFDQGMALLAYELYERKTK